MKRLRKLCYTLPFSWESRRVRPAVYGTGFVPRLGSEFSTAGGADACEAAGFAWCADAQPKATKSVSGLQLLIAFRGNREQLHISPEPGAGFFGGTDPRHDGVPFLKKSEDQCPPDKPCCSGEKNLHAASPSRSSMAPFSSPATVRSPGTDAGRPARPA